ncbi:hypothetical protein FOA52_005367 [Chlamydomonas sp. UWO 241]|nr:hypothetical protein FOA52_005367 [Chlamydomonas sp. UWO 241]
MELLRRCGAPAALLLLLALIVGRFGIDHIVVTTPSEEACAATVVQIPGICCVWSDIWFGMPPISNELARNGFNGHRRLMQQRLRFTALALRASYNVMFLDTDIIIFEDPYKYLKAPPFDAVNLVFSGNVLDANIGIMYAHNVAPDGPVAWIFAESADRMLRWSESPKLIENREWPVLRNFQHLMWDQSNWIDAYVSAQLGRPTFHAAWAFQGDNKDFNETWLADHHSRVMANRKEVKGVHTDASKAIARAENYEIETFKLNRVLTGGKWPVEFGGVGYPAERREYSKAWLAQLRAVGSPMWPEPDDPACASEPDIVVGEQQQQQRRQRQQQRRRRATATAADANAAAATAAAASATAAAVAAPAADPAAAAAAGQAPSELGSQERSRSLSASEGGCLGRGSPEIAAALPGWMLSFWSYMRKEAHHWDSRTTPATQVFGHNLFLPGDKRIYKNALKMAYGWYNWTLAQTSRHGEVYFASTKEFPVPQVLAMSDALLERFLFKPDPLEFLMSMRALFIAAAVSGRTLALPAFDCGKLAELIHAFPKVANLKMNNDAWFSSSSIPYPASAKDNQCWWSAYFGSSCLESGHGLLPVEFEYYLSTLKESDRTPGPANVLSLLHLSTVPRGQGGAQAQAQARRRAAATTRPHTAGAAGAAAGGGGAAAAAALMHAAGAAAHTAGAEAAEAAAEAAVAAGGGAAGAAAHTAGIAAAAAAAGGVSATHRHRVGWIAYGEGSGSEGGGSGGYGGGEYEDLERLSFRGQQQQGQQQEGQQHLQQEGQQQEQQQGQQQQEGQQEGQQRGQQQQQGQQQQGGGVGGLRGARTATSTDGETEAAAGGGSAGAAAAGAARRSLTSDVPGGHAAAAAGAAGAHGRVSAFTLWANTTLAAFKQAHSGPLASQPVVYLTSIPNIEDWEGDQDAVQRMGSALAHCYVYGTFLQVEGRA